MIYPILWHYLTKCEYVFLFTTLDTWCINGFRQYTELFPQSVLALQKQSMSQTVTRMLWIVSVHVRNIILSMEFILHHLCGFSHWVNRIINACGLAYTCWCACNRIAPQNVLVIAQRTTKNNDEWNFFQTLLHLFCQKIHS